MLLLFFKSIFHLLQDDYTYIYIHMHTYVYIYNLYMYIYIYVQQLFFVWSWSSFTAFSLSARAVYHLMCNKSFLDPEHPWVFFTYVCNYVCMYVHIYIYTYINTYIYISISIRYPCIYMQHPVSSAQDIPLARWRRRSHTDLEPRPRSIPADLADAWGWPGDGKRWDNDPTAWWWLVAMNF